MFKLFRSKFYTAIILLFSVFIIGMLGYKYLAHYSWIDAAYMTIITVTTVGFREVNPVDNHTKLFTIFLIISSVFIFAYAISVITEYILTKSSLHNFKNRKMKKKVDQLKNHIIICGYGRNGKQAASKLKAYMRPYVVIERDREVIEKYMDRIPFVEGDACEDEVLLKAGIDRANCLITALPEDADNLFVVLSSRQLNKKLKIISRASHETSQNKLVLAGANKTIMPDKIGGDHMASLVIMPDIIEFMDQLSIEGENTINLEEVAIDALPENYQNRSIKELDLRRKTGCTVIGYRNPQGIYEINPGAETKLLPDSKIVVLGRPEQIKKLNEMFNIPETYI